MRRGEMSGCRVEVDEVEEGKEGDVRVRWR